MVVNEKQIEYIISVIETSKKTQDEIATRAGISKSTMSRLMKHHQATKYTIDLLAAFFEVGDKVAELGGQEEQTACPLISGVSGELKRLAGIYAEREERLQSQCDERVAALKAQMDLQQKHYTEMIDKQEAKYNSNVRYLKDQVEIMQKERTETRAELDRQKNRADELDRKRHNVFWGMLTVIILLLVFMAVMMIVDAPGIGMGWG